MKISVIVPMYNECKIIEDTARCLSDCMRQGFDDYEIIFVDDGSSDASRKIVAACGLPCVRAIGYKENHGKGCAVRYGMLAATGELRVFTDADIAYGTDVIKKAVDILCENKDTDILIGSRNIDGDGYEGYTFFRRIMSKAYIKILCLAGGFKLSDSQCGFKAFRAQAAEEIFSECKVDGFAFDFEVILHALNKQKKISEMSVKIINHRDSTVRPFRDALKMLRDLRKIKREINSEK